MKEILSIPVNEMTQQVMMELEKLGLITRICPNHEQYEAAAGETTWLQMYEPKDGYGPHKLISIRVNRESFASFGTHPDNEEFWCIGDPDTQPMYIAIAIISEQSLHEKIASESLTIRDFVMLRVKYNDPFVSFFVMRAGVPHGEVILDQKKLPAGFYVTESRDLPLNLIDFGKYELAVAKNI